MPDIAPVFSPGDIPVAISTDTREADAQRAMRDTFGYVPNEADGERYTVYTDGKYPVLIVIHPARKPRLYYQHGRGVYIEFDPVFR